MKVYAVIDTNVIVSSILSNHSDSATVLVRDNILDGKLIPMFNEEILAEYKDVLNRPKFKFPSALVKAVLDGITSVGLYMERTDSGEFFPDPKDAVFYEVALSKEDSYLVTGNTKHFPKSSIVVTPAEMLEILVKSK